MRRQQHDCRQHHQQRQRRRQLAQQKARQQPGGERDGIGQRVSGVAPLSSGERVVLFLERTGPYHRVVGLAQGVYRVVPVEGSNELRAVPASIEGLELVSPPGHEPAARTPMPLSALRSSVLAAR